MMRYVTRMRDWLRSRSLSSEIEEELYDHLSRETERLQALGVPEREARRRAYAAFGGVARMREEVRDARGLNDFPAFVSDVRLAWRQFRRQWQVSLIAAGTLVLGIGAATTVFCAVDAVLVKPLPYQEPERLVTLWQTETAAGVTQDDFAVANFLDLDSRSKSFTGVAAANPSAVAYSADGVNERLDAWTVTDDFFSLIGSRALVGRTLVAEDFPAAGDPAPTQGVGAPPTGPVVLSFGIWQRKFGGDPGVLGRTIVLDGVARTIVGVMPRNFALPEATDLWLPNVWSEAQLSDRRATYIRVFARLRPGVTPSMATSEVAELARQIEREQPTTNSGVGVAIISLPDVIFGSHRQLLWVLLGAVAVLYVVVLANVGALRVARAASQRQETAVRTALGARTVHLFRTRVAESALLSLIGAAGGALASYGGVHIVRQLGPADVPRLGEIAVDARAWGVALVLAGVATVALTAIGTTASANALARHLNSSRGSVGSRSALRARRAAVLLQLSLSVVLLVGTLQLIRSLRAVERSDKGFRADKVLSFSTWVFGEFPTQDGVREFVERATARLRAVPGVTHVAVASSFPLTERITGEDARVIPNESSLSAGDEPMAQAAVVSPGYFETLGIRLISGRAFSVDDRPGGNPVMIVNESFARRFFAGQDPVGRSISIGLMGRPQPRMIVGVVADVRRDRVDLGARPAAYLPFSQRSLQAMTFVLRTTVDPSTLVRSAGSAIAEVDTRVSLARFATLESLVASQLRPRRFLLFLISGFACVSLLVSIVGVYGVMSQAVADRSREIGVRMALGASGDRVTGEFLREGLLLAGSSAAVGAVVTLATSKAISAFLYGVSAIDGASLLVASVSVVLLAVLATVLPATRATKVAPAIVLQA